MKNLKRSSVNITLVLVSATLFLSACSDEEEYESTPAGTNPATLPGGASGYHYSGGHYYRIIPGSSGGGSSFSSGSHSSSVSRGGFGSSIHSSS